MAYKIPRMIETLAKAVQGCGNLPETCQGLFNWIDSGDGKKLAYVAGKITSDGDDKAPQNIAKLEAYAEKIREEGNCQIFTALDVFYHSDIYFKLDEVRNLLYDQRERYLRCFWRTILMSGSIGVVYMTPGWETSKGASNEHEMAKSLDLPVVYIA